MNLPENWPDAAFGIANLAATSGWIALALAPLAARWRPALGRALERWAGRLLPLLLALAYGLLMARPWQGGGFGSLAEVRLLLAQPAILLAGWLHYLAFDLFVGTWIAQRARDIGLPYALLLPTLVLTFLLGPLGLLAFAVLRATLWRPAPPAGAAAAR